MLKHLVTFITLLLMPTWMRDKTPDEKHFYRRFFTAKHKAKRSKAKLLWISVLPVLLVFPNPPMIVTTILFTTFLTFSLLDESS